MITKPQYGAASAAIALTLFLAAPAPASADTTLIVGKANATSDAIIPVNVGDELGIFKKHGLTLKIQDFGGGSKMAQALAAGSIDIGDGAGTEMAFVAKGAPMMTICESTAPAPFLGIGVPWDSPIKTLDDLKGKRIGVSSPGSFSEWSGHVLARKKGWGENGVTTIAIGNVITPMKLMNDSDHSAPTKNQTTHQRAFTTSNPASQMPGRHTTIAGSCQDFGCLFAH